MREATFARTTFARSGPVSLSLSPSVPVMSHLWWLMTGRAMRGKGTKLGEGKGNKLGEGKGNKIGEGKGTKLGEW